jgi:hypothetical protein
MFCCPVGIGGVGGCCFLLSKGITDDTREMIRATKPVSPFPFPLPVGEGIGERRRSPANGKSMRRVYGGDCVKASSTVMLLGPKPGEIDRIKIGSVILLLGKDGRPCSTPGMAYVHR